MIITNKDQESGLLSYNEIKNNSSPFWIKTKFTKSYLGFPYSFPSKKNDVFSAEKYGTKGVKCNVFSVDVFSTEKYNETQHKVKCFQR